MANHPARVESPAVAELVRALQSVRPELRGGGIGTIRSDGSRHTAGLAADIMLDSKTPAEKAAADSIIAALIAVVDQIKWHDIMYTDWIENPTTGRKEPFHFHIPSRYGIAGGYGGRVLTKNHNSNRALGREHENHIHVDWVDFALRIEPFETVFVYDWPADAMTTGFTAALIGQPGVSVTVPTP